MVGDPFVNCYQEPTSSAECRSDSECASDKACINERCQNPCAESNPCAGNAECRVANHRPLCYCPQGWGGDPQVQCFRRKFHQNCVIYYSLSLQLNLINSQLNARTIPIVPTTRLVTTKSAWIHAITAHCIAEREPSALRRIIEPIVCVSQDTRAIPWWPVYEDNVSITRTARTTRRVTA